MFGALTVDHIVEEVAEGSVCMVFDAAARALDGGAMEEGVQAICARAFVGDPNVGKVGGEEMESANRRWY